jgi:GT2 family glycosyltransferase
MIRSQFPNVTFIQSNDNLGFAKANNLGLARSTGDTVLFLNPDTVIQGAALQSLLAVLHSKPSIGMVGARLLNSDHSLQDNCITALPTVLNQALSSNLLRRRFPKSRLWGKQAFFANPEVPAQVEAISGACMLAKREAIAAIQGFHAGFFMYAEDMDLCLRIAEAGWEIYYAPEARIVHHAGGSSSSCKENNFSSIMIRESLTHFFRLHRGAFHAWLFRMSCTVASSLRVLLLTLLLSLAIGSSRRQRYLRAMHKWANVFFWSIGQNEWAVRKSNASQSARAIAHPRLDKLPESSA